MNNSQITICFLTVILGEIVHSANMCRMQCVMLFPVMTQQVTGAAVSLTMSVTSEPGVAWGRRGGEEGRRGEVAWGGHSLDKARLSVMQGFASDIQHCVICVKF